MKNFKRFVELTKQKRQMKENLRELESELRGLEAEILEEMADSGIGHINIDGATVYLSEMTTAKPIGGKDEVLAYTKRIAPELVKETYNTNSFNAYIREMIEQDQLPEDFDEHFEIETFHKAKVRMS